MKHNLVRPSVSCAAQALRKIRTAAAPGALDALPEQCSSPPAGLGMEADPKEGLAAGAKAAGLRDGHKGGESEVRGSGEQGSKQAPGGDAAGEQQGHQGFLRGGPGGARSPPSPPIRVPETPLTVSFLGQALPPGRRPWRQGFYQRGSTPAKWTGKALTPAIPNALERGLEFNLNAHTANSAH